MLEGGRWQVGKPEISPLQLGPALWAGGLCWEKLGLEVSKVVLWCNTCCGRNLPSVWLKDLVSELLINHSCWRSVVPDWIMARLTAALFNTDDRCCQVGV